MTGSLQMAPKEQFDLVMTNIPYVIRGTGKQREFLQPLKDYYSIPGSGLENLFMQLIVNGLKPGCKALVVVPDGLLMRHSEEPLRAHLLRTCILEGLISLPINTFYSTPKKTYIMVLRKKQKPDDHVQSQSVFTYLVNSTGETLDAKRFVISENDLPVMASSFKQFQGNPEAFITTDPRCKVFSAKKFKTDDHWLINKWWSLDEREKLGDIEAECFIGTDELTGMLKETAGVISKQAKAIASIEEGVPIKRTVTLSLSDARYFRMAIGERVLKKDLFHAERGSVPLYSANVEPGFEHGWIKQSNIADFSNPSVLWSMDNDFNLTVRKAGEVFAATDHCGRLEILDKSLDPFYCQAAIIYGYGRTFGFDRVMRPSIKRMKKVSFRIPVKADGTFDLEAQRSLAKGFIAVQDAIRITTESLESIKDLKPKAEIPKDAIDMGVQPGRIEMTTKRRRHTHINTEDHCDLEIAQARLNEIKAAPKKVVKGAELDKRMKQWVS
jgi:hypothetical protein